MLARTIVAAPAGGVVIVHGEPDVGKSALVLAAVDSIRASEESLWRSVSATCQARPAGAGRDSADTAAGRCSSEAAASVTRAATCPRAARGSVADTTGRHRRAASDV